MTKGNDAMKEIFDLKGVVAELAPVVVEPIVLPAVIEPPKPTDVESDFEIAQATLREVITKGKMALDGILNVAETDETARSYEVAATMLKTVSETAQQLLTLQETMKKIRTKDVGSNPAGMNYIDKAVFVGSPSDLLERVKGNQFAHGK